MYILETLGNHKKLRVVATQGEQTKWNHIKCSLNLMKLQREHRLNVVNLKIIIDMTYIEAVILSSVQSLSRVRLFDPTNHSTPGLPVHHQLPELTQTHVH